jgi:hypothetical protein
MKLFVVTAAILLCSGMSLRAGQSPNAGGQSNSDTAKAAAQSSGNSADTAADKSKNESKKVWTNEEITNVGGEGAVSVVGKAGGGNSNRSSNNSSKNNSGLSAKETQAAMYRDQLHKLNISLQSTEKKIAELRAFKGDNSSPSGGINVTQRYYMATVEDQVKQLEEKKKQIKAQIDAVEERARKNGFEPGLLR